jgi:hypothetical protein
MQAKRFEDIPSDPRQAKSLSDARFAHGGRRLLADSLRRRRRRHHRRYQSALDKILEFGETTSSARRPACASGTLVRALAERGQELPLTPEMGNISLGALAVTTCRKPPTARARAAVVAASRS